jgi:peptide/nickel transport system permease protein
MTAFIIRRVMQSGAVMLITTLLVFFGLMVIGDPLDIMIDPQLCDAACEQRARIRLGLDRPLYAQYVVFIGNLLTGDLGESFVYGTPVGTLILERLPATLELALFAMFLTVALGIPLGLWAGFHPEAGSGKTIMAGSVLGFSLPSFWVGIVLIMVFGVELGWLPANGRGETADVFGVPFSLITWNGLSHIILPAFNLSLVQMCLVIRLTRSGVRETVHLDFVKFAHAKGLRHSRIVFVHILKNILIPIVTVLGLELGGLLAYSLVTETVFSWPGLGKLLIDSINGLDRPIVVSYLTLTVLVFIMINLLVDILYSVIDPRIRLQDMHR